MNILILSPFFPYPLDQGGKIRVFNLVQCLARNHRITLACLSSEKASIFGPLTDLCDEIVIVTRKERFALDFVRFLFGGESFNCARFSSGRFANRLSDLLARKSFDLVQIEFSMLWQYAKLFTDIPVSLDAHNIEYRNVQQIGEGSKGLAKRWLYRIEASRLRAVEERAWRECALCLTVSDRERDEIAACAGDPAKVITAPNGVDPERFAFKPRAEAGRNILFLGGMDYTPNLDAARWFLDDIFPSILLKVAQTCLHFVGRGLWRLGERSAVFGNVVELHENVPEALPWFYDADLLVVPLRLGAGTRIKVLEAFAAGLPVVSTTKGCEGLAVRDGEHLLIADTKDEIAVAIAQLMSDSNLRVRLTDNARRLVEDKYTWEKVNSIMVDAYRQIVSA